MRRIPHRPLLRHREPQKYAEEHQRGQLMSIARYHGLTGVDGRDADIDVVSLSPTRHTGKSGDREVFCVATFDPPLTGSLRG